MRTVDKLDKIGPEKVRALLIGEEIGIPASAADEILRFIAIRGSNAEVLAALEGYAGQNELFDRAWRSCDRHRGIWPEFGVPESNFAVDLTIARGLDYYTGTVYETTMLDHPEIGSVCSGGRYDNLAEYYTDKQLPGVGISIGLTRLFFVLQEQGMLNPDLPTAPADVLVIPMTEELPFAVRCATTLRDAGHPHPALHRAEEVQGQDELCRQAGHPLRRAHRRGRDRPGQGVPEGHVQRQPDPPDPGSRRRRRNGGPGSPQRNQGHPGIGVNLHEDPRLCPTLE